MSKYTMTSFLIILTLLLGCKMTKYEYVNEAKETEILTLISELKRLSQESRDLLFKSLSIKLEDSEREEIVKEYESSRKKVMNCTNSLIRIGPQIIPYALEVIKDTNLPTEVRVPFLIVLSEVSKDRDDQKLIEELLKIPFMERVDSIAVMGVLINIGKPAIPYVIDQLEHENADKRIWAFELLKILTSKNFDYYNPQDQDIKKRKEAVNRIRDWWEENKNNLVTPRKNKGGQSHF